MLVLTRKENEKILIGPIPKDIPEGTIIEIQVTSIQRGRVRIGITTPMEIPIDREEIREEKNRSERRKSGS
jgi:carbon storage regulator CsrA